jgi:hypothetical protein
MIYFKDLSNAKQDEFSDLDEESKQTPLEWDGSVIRFRGNLPMQYVLSHININDLWDEAIRNKWPIKEMMRFYRMLGYSLCGFMEVFGENRIKRGHC